MAYDTPREVVASAARTTSGQSSMIPLRSAADAVNLQVNITAASGTTPTLDLTVEWSMDGGTSWSVAEPADAFTQITGVTTRVKRLVAKATAYRIRWAIAGTTPSFTFAVAEYPV